MARQNPLRAATCRTDPTARIAAWRHSTVSADVSPAADSTTSSISPSRAAASACATIRDATEDVDRPSTSSIQDRLKSRLAIEPTRPADCTRLRSLSSTNNVVMSERAIIRSIPIHTVHRHAAMQHNGNSAVRSLATRPQPSSATLLQVSSTLQCQSLSVAGIGKSRWRPASKARDHDRPEGRSSCDIAAHRDRPRRVGPQPCLPADNPLRNILFLLFTSDGCSPGLGGEPIRS